MGGRSSTESFASPLSVSPKTLLSYVGSIALELYWWCAQKRCITGVAMSARIAEISFLLEMAASWWTMRHLFHKRSPVIETIMGDKSLLMYSAKYIIGLYAMVLVYMACTTAVYAMILIHNPFAAQPAQDRFLIFVFVQNVPFAASLMLFSMSCLHVRHQVHLFAHDVSCGVQYHADFVAHFDFVCNQMELLGKFFNPYLSACNFCAVVKFLAVTEWRSNEALMVDFTFWLNVLLSSRTILTVLALDWVGATVASSGVHIQQRIVSWRFPDEEFGTVCDFRQCYEHTMLVHRCDHLMQRNFNSLKVFGVPLTTKTYYSFFQILGVVVVHSAVMQSLTSAAPA